MKVFNFNDELRNLVRSASALDGFFEIANNVLYNAWVLLYL